MTPEWLEIGTEVEVDERIAAAMPGGTDPGRLPNACRGRRLLVEALTSWHGYPTAWVRRLRGHVTDSGGGWGVGPEPVL